MKKDVIDIIMEKEYHTLTAAERVALSELCSSEEEYDRMKAVFLGIENMSKSGESPRPETKERLDMLFNATYPKARPVWYMSVLSVVAPKDKPFARQPLVQIAAVGLLLLLLVPFWNRVSVIEQSDQLAHTEVPQNVSSKPSGGTQPSVETSNTAENTVKPKDDSNNARSFITKGESNRDEALSQPTMDDAAVVADLQALDLMDASFAAADKTEHPDGVYIALSQPADETPEMFDLLTVTF
jgi:hypothetical protein